MRWLSVVVGALVWMGGVAPGVAARPSAALAAGGIAPPVTLRSPLTDDPRSTILLRYDCWSEVGRREVTLFGDGTVRLRKGVSATETGQVAEDRGESRESAEGRADTEMRLYDLDPDSLDAYRARLADIDLEEVELERNPVEGEWVERCVLAVLHDEGADGEGVAEQSYRFSRYSALPLELSRLVRVAEDLIAEVEESVHRRLPPDYVPRPGDVLERVDGVRFEVVTDTVDGKGLELLGVDAPLVLYLTPDDLRQRFVRVLERGGGRGDGR